MEEEEQYEEGYAEEEAYEEEEGHEGGWEEAYEEEAAAPDAEADGEGAEQPQLTEAEEIALLEQQGWVNTSKVRGPPARLAPKPPSAQDKLAKGKVETWQQVKSDRNWSADVDLSHRDDAPASEAHVGGAAAAALAFPPEVTSKYEVGPVLGTGAFGVVRQGTSKADKRVVALKLQTSASAPGVDLAAQHKTLAAVSGKRHLSTLLESIPCSGGSFCSVLKLESGRDLLHELAKDAAQPWTERDAAGVVRSLLEALQELHAAQVVHLNVTADNIMYDSAAKALALQGFTLSRMCLSPPITTPVAGGSPQFQAPEVVFNTGYSFAADLWSAGVVAYVLLTGHVPFAETHPVRLKVAVKKGIATFPAHMSADAVALIKALCAIDPTARPTAAAALQLPFLVAGGSATVVPNFRASVAALAK